MDNKKENVVIKFFKNSIVRTVLIFVLVFSGSYLYFHFTMQPVFVDGTSMNPTLEHKDYGLSDKLYWKIKGLKRFDIVTFEHLDDLLVKRVIALEGEHIEYKDGVLKINGNVVEEEFLEEDAKLATTEVNGNIDLVVPEGKVFVMGDNRFGTNSYDSRMMGCIKVSKIESVGLLLIGECKSITGNTCKGHKFSWPKKVK